MGRKSGQPQTVVIILIETRGLEYLVSAQRESDRVRKLRAEGVARLKANGHERSISVDEVDGFERDRILAIFQENLEPTVAVHFRATRVPGDHPVFRITPA